MLRRLSPISARWATASGMTGKQMGVRSESLGKGFAWRSLALLCLLAASVALAGYRTEEFAPRATEEALLRGLSGPAVAEDVAEIEFVVEVASLTPTPSRTPPARPTLPPGTPTLTPAPTGTPTATTGPTRPAVDATAAARGSELFVTLGCDTCHPGGGAGAGPSLVGLPGRREMLQGGESVTADEEYIRRSILNPGAQVVAGYDDEMPSFEGQVNDRELEQLLAYIRSLGG